MSRACWTEQLLVFFLFDNSTSGHWDHPHPSSSSSSSASFLPAVTRASRSGACACAAVSPPCLASRNNPAFNPLRFYVGCIFFPASDRKNQHLPCVMTAHAGTWGNSEMRQFARAHELWCWCCGGGGSCLATSSGSCCCSRERFLCLTVFNFDSKVSFKHNRSNSQAFSSSLRLFQFFTGILLFFFNAPEKSSAKSAKKKMQETIKTRQSTCCLPLCIP